MKIHSLLFVFACLVSCTQNSPEKMSETTQAGLIEVTTFKLNKGVAHDEFVQSAKQIEVGFLNKQKGYLSRTLTVGADSVWTDIAFWKDEASQAKAMQESEKAAEAMSFMEKIDFNTVKMTLSKPQVTSN
jgi:hypothetical protein